MNPELQSQTDVLVKVITHLETTLHQDLLLVVIILGVIFISLCLTAMLRRQKISHEK
jgi:hypothetical protein